jgi:hypothetical protein
MSIFQTHTARPTLPRRKDVAQSEREPCTGADHSICVRHYRSGAGLFVCICRAFFCAATTHHHEIIFLLCFPRLISSLHNFVALFAWDSFIFVGIYISYHVETIYLRRLKILLFQMFRACLRALNTFAFVYAVFLSSLYTQTDFNITFYCVPSTLCSRSSSK